MLPDFHCHILPGIDDGSRNVEESRGLLDMLKDQGVDVVVATPHFEADHESVESFLCRRADAYRRLGDMIIPDMPKILLGAEVAYYPGISRLEGLQDLCIEGTDLLLLEMPMSKWSKYMLDELVNLSYTRKVRVVVAHVERYLQFQDRATINALCESDVLLQINSSFILNLSTRRKSLSWMKKGLAHVIGSDCHNLRSRRPRLNEAYDIITKRLGDGFVRELIEFEKNLITK